MDLRLQFLIKYGFYRSLARRRLLDLTDGQLRGTRGESSTQDPTPRTWHLWRMARLEDSGFARLAAQPELIQDSAWPERLRLSPDQAAANVHGPADQDLVAAIDLPTLREYWAEVEAHTRQLLPGIPEEQFDELVDGGYAPVDDGNGEVQVRWMTRYRSGRRSLRPLPTPAHDIRREVRGCLRALFDRSR